MQVKVIRTKFNSTQQQVKVLHSKSYLSKSTVLSAKIIESKTCSVEIIPVTDIIR